MAGNIADRGECVLLDRLRVWIFGRRLLLRRLRWRLRALLQMFRQFRRLMHEHLLLPGKLVELLLDQFHSSIGVLELTLELL